MTDDMFPTVSKSPFAAQGPVPQTLKIVLCTLVPDEGEGCSAAIDPRLLDGPERERAARFVFARDRWSYAAAHALLRAMLAEFHGLPPLAWRFRDNGHGRPEIDPAIATPTLPRFNISHTHDMAVCALTDGTLPEGVEIGIDAECLDRSPDSLALADRYFSRSESEWLRTQPEARLDTEFLRLWTLKEAVAKAIGLGLGLDFRTFRCGINPLSVSFDTPEWGPTNAWDLQNWFVDPCHWVSLAVRRPPGTLINLEIRHLHGTPHTTAEISQTLHSNLK